MACTSGTAAANYAPAVDEADQAGVPLIVLTADRPPELRDVGAGQTIDQIKLYGRRCGGSSSSARMRHTPERERWVRTLACRVVQAATAGRPGPVHVNFALREPLVPDGPLRPRAGGRPRRRTRRGCARAAPGGRRRMRARRRRAA